MESSTKYLTISTINRYLKDQFDRNDHLRSVFLKGEISNFKGHTTGHLYFSLKDETSKINAIMFSRSAAKLTFKPIDGTKVLVMGRISVYEATGSYQIYVDDMQEDGVGNLHIAFEKLKEQLSKEGLFNSKYKKPIPKYPARIGIVTAPTGAAIKDILSTLKRRYPVCETILFPSLVQGEYAAPDIVRNIKRAENHNLDLLIVGRGGGSIEDLWAFNEEIVARAIFECSIPIISAVGHEVDFTIADFVADYRAPTPTGAAEMAVPNIIELKNYINQLKIRLSEGMRKKVNYQKLYMDSIKNSYVIKSPMIIFDARRQKLDLLLSDLNESIVNYIDNKKDSINNFKNSYIIKNPNNLYEKKKTGFINLIEKLELVNPLGVLKRGYSVSYIGDTVLSSIKKIKDNDNVNIRLYDGMITAKVEKIEER
jgi:exodeoxyribonuclease VII, large subunit